MSKETTGRKNFSIFILYSLFLKHINRFLFIYAHVQNKGDKKGASLSPATTHMEGGGLILFYRLPQHFMVLTLSISERMKT